MLTHEVTEQEAAAGAVAFDPDLSPFFEPLTRPSAGREPPLWLAFGAQAATLLGQPHTRVLTGPAGWLPGGPGTLIHARLLGGQFTVAAGPRPDPESTPAERRLADSARRGVARDRGNLGPGMVRLEHVVVQAVAEAPGLLDQPIAPLRAVFAQAGLSTYLYLIGSADHDWGQLAWLDGLAGSIGPDESDDDWDAPTIDDQVDALVHLYDLDVTEERAVRILLETIDLERLGPIRDQKLLGALATIIDSAPVVLPIVRGKIPFDRAAGAIVERILASQPAAGAGLLFLAAGAAEARDEPLVAEERLLRALEVDPTDPLSLVDLAGYELDRGRFREALALLRGAGVRPTDHRRAWLEELLAPVPGVGRNDPCPCGSGRKAKRCHPAGLGEREPGPVERLHMALGRWLARPELEEQFDDLMHDVGMHQEAGEPDDSRLRTSLLDDVMLHDRGQLDRFLAVRGPLLPAADLTLGQSWLATRRRMYEVRSVDGHDITLMDLADGSSAVVHERAMAAVQAPGDLLCLRLAQDGKGDLVAIYGIGAARSQRDVLASLVATGDGVALVRYVIDAERGRIVAPEAVV